MKSPFLFPLSLWLLVSGGIRAGVLETVPRQGGMLMPEVYYHADTDTVTVDLSGVTSGGNQLTPLLISNPRDSFDPASAWFDCLDPSRQGRAFSRRYGWDMDRWSDLLPANRALWIRNLGSSPELEFYDYNDYVSPLTWKPIWGTAGTSNATVWNRIMWHFGATVPPGSNVYSATFEVYVVDTTTGQEVPGSGSGPLPLTWTSVPDGRPVLTITNSPPGAVTISWPASATNWSMFWTTNLLSTNWLAATNSVVALGSYSTVIFSNTLPRQFYRLQYSY
jgi:hypothetical protein